MKTLTKKVALSLLFWLCLCLSPFLKVTPLAGEIVTDNKLAEPKLNVTEVSLVTEDQFNLKVYNLTEDQRPEFKSADSDIVSVSKSGKLSAQKVGETVITVTLYDEDSKEFKVLKCKVYVGPPAISIRLTLSEITLEVGKKKTLQAILKPNTTAESATFASCDKDIVTVSATGRVLAKKIGKTYVISSIENGKYDICAVTVVEK